MATRAKKTTAKRPTSTKTTAKKVPRKKSSTSGNGSTDVCFVIMPFGGWLDSYYSLIYRPAIEAAGLDPHRADDLFRPSTIVNDIWAYTKKSKVLLADLTGKNPNVFYELGLAHALAKPVILIAESMDDIPFDLRALRIILYDKNAHDWGKLLGQKIENALREVLASPVEAVLPAFLDVREANKASISQEQKDLIEIKQEMDLLRRSVAIRESSYLESERAQKGSEYARELIVRYLGREMPRSLLARRVAEETGAPIGWVERQVDEYLGRNTSAIESGQPSTPRSRNPLSERTPEQEKAIRMALRTLEQQADSTRAMRNKQTPTRPSTNSKPGRVSRVALK